MSPKFTAVVCIAAFILAACSEKQPIPEKPAPSPVTKTTPSKTKPQPLPQPPKPKEASPEVAQKNMSAKYGGDSRGRVSTKAMLESSVRRLMSYDKDKNNVLSAAEFHEAMGDSTNKDPVIADLMKRLDANKDGSLDERELASYMWPGIVALDKNHDGFIDNADSRIKR